MSSTPQQDIPSYSQTKKPFLSCLEMIGVVIILAFITVLVIPIFIRVHETTVTCMSNEKMLGLASIMYSEDSDDKFPPFTPTGVSWAERTQPYVKEMNVYQCSVDPTQLPPERAKAGYSVMSYGMNMNADGAYKGNAKVSFADPSVTVLLFEVQNAEDILRPKTETTIAPGTWGDGAGAFTYPAHDLGGAFVPFGRGANIAVIDGREVFTPIYATGNIGGRMLNVHDNRYTTARHRPGANYAFCDGHVKMLKADKVSGGADAPESDCNQDTSPTQPRDCKVLLHRAPGLRPVAAGTSGLGATFSTK